MSEQTYKLQIQITDTELNALLYALDGHRNEYLDERKAVKKERKNGKLSRRDAAACRRLYTQGIQATASLEAKISNHLTA